MKSKAAIVALLSLLCAIASFGQGDGQGRGQGRGQGGGGGRGSRPVRPKDVGPYVNPSQLGDALDWGADGGEPVEQATTRGAGKTLEQIRAMKVGAATIEAWRNFYHDVVAYYSKLNPAAAGREAYLTQLLQTLALGK